MTLDIEKLAREAGADGEFWLGGETPPTCFDSLPLFEKFAALVLEQAAQKCDSVAVPHLMVGTSPESAWEYGTIECADAIRAMKPKTE